MLALVAVLKFHNNVTNDEKEPLKNQSYVTFPHCDAEYVNKRCLGKLLKENVVHF